jgi:rRNA maturation endonuclease Nob1
MKRTHCPNDGARLLPTLFANLGERREMWKGVCARCSYMTPFAEFEQDQTCTQCGGTLHVRGSTVHHNDGGAKCGVKL